jgi:uncharacterized OB-fold protein
MVSQYTKPLPAPDLDTARFWEGCREHKLLAQKCSSCGAFRWPPRDLCPKCRSWDCQWVRLAGTAIVSSFVVVHHVTVPAFADEAPYAVARVTLDGTDDKVRMTTNIIDCPWAQVRVGMPVTVVFEDVTPEVTLPKFRPV